MFNPHPAPPPQRRQGRKSRQEDEGERKGGGRVRREGGKAERIYAFYIQMAQKNHCPPHSHLNTADLGDEKQPSLSKDQFGNRSQIL